MKEIWKDIKGYEGLYKVSNLGMVKSLDKKVKHKIENFTNKKGKILKATDNHGYLKVVIFKKNFRVHRLVANAFIFNPENYKFVNHKDGIKTNNNILNLEWISSSDNLKHAYKLGLKSAKGEKNGRSKLTKKDVLEIRQKFKSGNYTKRELGIEYNTCKSNIKKIVNYKRWTHI